MSEYAVVYHPDEIDALVDELTKPFYLLRMARGMVMSGNKNIGQINGAQVRARNAKKEIRRILEKHNKQVSA